MPVTCPRCDAPVQPDAPTCNGCGFGLAPSGGMSMTLQFPAVHPEIDVLTPDTRSRAPAPTLMPGSPPPAANPAPSPAEQDQGRPQQKKIFAVLGAVTVVVAVVVTVALVTNAQDAPPASSGNNPVGATTEFFEPDSGSTEPTSNPAPTDENSARQMLENQVENDRSQVEALTGYWVPQLSSKRLGLVANGTTYDYQTIWADFMSLQESYPGALLLWSGDYSGFRLTNFWVTISPQSHDSGEAANGWCDSAGIGKDDCYAKRITHTDGYAESTLLRQ